MPVPAPNPIVNQQFLSDDGVWNFSDQADSVNLSNFSDSYGQRIRMWGGNDFVIASTFNSPGYDNIVNGNLGNDLLGLTDNGANTREWFLGGKESDDLRGNQGDDWVNGNNDDDFVFGGSGNDIARGGKDNDSIFGESGNDILIGDFGSDFLYGQFLLGQFTQNRFILRTDQATIDGIFYNNLTGNPAEADTIVDFNLFGDKIVIPGVASFAELNFMDASLHGFASGTLVSAEFGGIEQFIGYIADYNMATMSNPSYYVVGQTASNFYNSISPDSFLTNPSLFSTV